MGFGTSYAIIWAACLLVSWIHESIFLFLLSICNLFSFNGVLAYKELHGTEHVVFVMVLLLSHGFFQHHVSSGPYAKDFSIYHIITTFSTIVLIGFILLWFLAERILKSKEAQIAAAVFELVLWW